MTAADHWRDLVRGRSEQLVAPQPDFWSRRAPAFLRLASIPDPLMGVLDPWLAPSKTLIDVGAGVGRHAAPLADRLEWVTAIEPADGMREHIPHRDNMTVVASSWEDAEVQPADLVLCSHVLYGVEEPVPFIEKMEKSARERVFIYIRTRQLAHPGDALYRYLTGTDRIRFPEMHDLLDLLAEMGIVQEHVTVSYPTGERWPSVDAAAQDIAPRIGQAWDDNRARAWLAENLVASDGEFTYGIGEMTSGVVHWKPRS